jgi:hypothetical protein
MVLHHADDPAAILHSVARCRSQTEGDGVRAFWAVAIFFCLCSSATPQTAAQIDASSTRTFLMGCRQERTACMSYVWGVIDGTIVARNSFNTPERFCAGTISYYEIGNGFLAYLETLAVTNSAALSQYVLVTLVQYLDSRYPCGRR